MHLRLFRVNYLRPDCPDYAILISHVFAKKKLLEGWDVGVELGAELRGKDLSGFQNLTGLIKPEIPRSKDLRGFENHGGLVKSEAFEARPNRF